MHNDVLDDFVKNTRNSYSSEKIYNYDKPIVEDILQYYKNRTDANPINDYRVFYLLSNNMMELKCKHQITLLKNTTSFIKALEN